MVNPTAKAYSKVMKATLRKYSLIMVFRLGIQTHETTYSLLLIYFLDNNYSFNILYTLLELCSFYNRNMSTNQSATQLVAKSTISHIHYEDLEVKLF